MADATAFYRTMASDVGQFLTALDKLRVISDRIGGDDTLAIAAAAAAATGGRPDIVAQDIINAKSAIDQLLFTFNSGAPPQKKYLYELL